MKLTTAFDICKARWVIHIDSTLLGARTKKLEPEPRNN